MKKQILILVSLAAVAVLLGLPAGASGIRQGTTGTELQVLKPERLELVLGREFAGSAFSLETDAGYYPGSIAADQTGTVLLELGGSSCYRLKLLNPAADAPGEETILEPSAAGRAEPSTREPDSESAAPTEGAAEQTEPLSKPGPAARELLVSAALGGSALTVGILAAWKEYHRRKQEHPGQNSQTDL